MLDLVPAAITNLGAMTKEQGARSREQGARSKEQGAKSKEQVNKEKSGRGKGSRRKRQGVIISITCHMADCNNSWAA